MIQPKIFWAPEGDESLGNEAIAWWESHGGHLFEWQKFGVRTIFRLGPDGRFVTGNDGLCVARQNGKGIIEQVVEGFLAFEVAGYELICHTAHLFPTAQEHQLRLERFIQDAPGLHAKIKDKGGYVHANGQESIRLKNGVRIIFKARYNGGGRGYSGDLLVWDEAMILPATVVGDQKPLLRASKAPYGQKTIYAGSAVDQENHPHGISFALIRERGVEQSESVSWMEWGAPFDSPLEMPVEVLRDRSWWPLANPSIPDGLIAESYMADEIETMPGRQVAVELGNVGDWPRTDGLEDSVIDIEAWDSLISASSVLQEPFCGAFDVSPERHGSIAVAGRNDAGFYQCEIHENRPGTGWMVDRICEMDERGIFEAWVCDATGPASSLLVELKDRGVRVETVNATEHGQAWGRFVDMVEQRELEHLGSEELRDAIRGAKARPIGDGSFAWARRNSSVNISPLVAATLALGLASGIGATVQVF